ncbi:MAG: rhodanese-like domain-containing protein [Gammaproteobacteria bacterium]|nr:rhodanese-like domain-containing protein [Gammaproteobacteria bacterium]
MTKNIDVSKARDLIKQGKVILIDVREGDEFKAEHIANAISIPLSTLEAGFLALDIPPSKTILFQCLKGSRGQMACTRIAEMDGIENEILNTDGGIGAWKSAGFPVIGGACCASAKISIFRQVQIIVGFLVAAFVIIGIITKTPMAFVVAGGFGGALFMAGVTGWCGLAMLLAKMPWNKSAA